MSVTLSGGAGAEYVEYGGATILVFIAVLSSEIYIISPSCHPKSLLQDFSERKC